MGADQLWSSTLVTKTGRCRPGRTRQGFSSPPGRQGAQKARTDSSASDLIATRSFEKESDEGCRRRPLDNLIAGEERELFPVIRRVLFHRPQPWATTDGAHNHTWKTIENPSGTDPFFPT